MPGSPKYSNLIAAIATIASCDIALGFTLQIGLAASGGRLIREAPHG